MSLFPRWVLRSLAAQEASRRHYDTWPSDWHALVAICQERIPGGDPIHQDIDRPPILLKFDHTLRGAEPGCLYNHEALHANSCDWRLGNGQDQDVLRSAPLCSKRLKKILGPLKRQQLNCHPKQRFPVTHKKNWNRTAKTTT